MTQRIVPAFGKTTDKLRHRLGRRGLLRGLLAAGGMAAIPLPVLDIMLNESGTAYAAGAPLRRCYVTWFFGNGVLPGMWVPTATGLGDKWALSAQLQPLAALKPQLTVVSGLGHSFSAGGPHPDGSAASNTGAGSVKKTVQLMSIDQIVANVIGTTTPFKSLQMGVTPATPDGSDTPLKAISHTGPNAPLVPEFNPAKVFNRIFSGVTGSSTTVDPKQANLATLKGSVLDSVVTDINELDQTLGATDRARLDGHLQGIRQLENLIKDMSTAAPATCAAPAQPTVGTDSNSEVPPAVNTAMVGLAAMALACDRTRVIAFNYSLPAAHIYYRELAANMDADFHNTICHGDAGTSSSQPRVNTGVLYTMKCFAEFLTKLQSISEGSSTLLDNSLVYATSCTSWGKIHTTNEWPVLLAGKAGGSFAGNQHFRLPNGNLSQVLLTIANAMGANLTTIGLGSGQVSQELSGLRITA
jgi:Protein of unknown function (DUF1552)